MCRKFHPSLFKKRNTNDKYSPHFFFIQRFVPSAPGKSTMRYEVYRNKTSSDEDFDLISSMYRRIMSEDKELCTRAQLNITRGVFVNGELHPEKEKGPLFFQKSVRELVTAHYAREQAAGEEIWPARQRLPQEGAEVSEKDVGFCAAVDCAKMREELAF